MTTLHLGDCLNGCETCCENYHSEVIGATCPTCGDYIEENVETTFTCQLCGEDGKDIFTGAVVLPWGDTCQECLNLIKETENN